MRGLNKVMLLGNLGKDPDIHSERMVINIKGAKGKKDRTVTLSPGILELLRKYYQAYKPTDWLFEGQHQASPYSTEACSKLSIEQKPEQGFYNPLLFIVYGTVMSPTCMNAERI
jgi:hypothetical protein